MEHILGTDGERVMNNVDDLGLLLSLSALVFLISTNRINSVSESMLGILLQIIMKNSSVGYLSGLDKPL